MVTCLALTIWQLPAMIHNKKAGFFFSTLRLMADLFFSPEFCVALKETFLQLKKKTKQTVVLFYHTESVRFTVLKGQK